MNFISEIFSSTSEQARLATTLIAASIAILVVLANQWFNSRRTKSEKIIEKIEETYLSIIKLEEISSNVHSEIIINYQKYEKGSNKDPYNMYYETMKSSEEILLEDLHKQFYREEAVATMLSGLYFPELKEDIAMFKKNYQSLYHDFISSEKLVEYATSSKIYRPKMQVLLDNAYKKLSIIMSKRIN